VVALALSLGGCAALPTAAWVAIGSIAGAVSASAQLDETAINAYLSLKNKRIAAVPATPKGAP
jgi:hypothetical protein